MLSRLRRFLVTASAKSRVALTTVQTLLFVLPLKSVSNVRSDARREIQSLEAMRHRPEQRQIVVRFDTRDSFPGMGDLFLIIMLANYVSALGNKSVFSTNLGMGSSDEVRRARTVEYERLIQRFLSPSVLLRTELSIACEAEDYLLFSHRVIHGLDISAVAIQFMGRLFRNRKLNPRRISPIYQSFAEADQPTKVGKTTSKAIASIGYHVRFSKHALDRNPSSDLAAEDCTALMKAFPGSQIVWFGEREQFDKVRSRFLPNSDFSRRVSYQESSSFDDAVVEAFAKDFWFQRFGGGIGAPLIFGSKPYLVLSGDPVPTRYYFYKNRRIVPWATKNQKWHLLLLNRERPAARFLRFRNLTS